LKEIGYSELEGLFTAALANLEAHKAFVNSLNVFPVPDGDTGTNMALTLKTALEEVEKKSPISVREFMSTLSGGSLIGARGNSGVILSQIIRGMAVSADSKSTLTTVDFSQMLSKATEVAYKAVVTPVEGTILTVVRRMAESASVQHQEDYVEYLTNLIATGRQAVKETMAQLPALAEAHVVDAGAEGLVMLLEGMLMKLRGETVLPGKLSLSEEPEEHVQPQNLVYRYDTVMLVASDTLPAAEISAKLTEHGDSLVMASSGGLTKIHVHTNEPYDVIQYLMTFAPIREGRIEDMQVQADAYAAGPAVQGAAATPLISTEGCGQETVDRAYVVVSPGPGFDNIFRKLGAHIIVSGGDTMNPPTEAFLESIRSCNAKSFIIFPNNKNIVMAAKQAADLLDNDVHVLNSRHPVQAIAALVQLASCRPEDDWISVANEAIAATDFFAVTRATKDATVSGFVVHEGDYMLLVDDMLAGLGQTVGEALGHLRDASIAWGDKSLLSAYRGTDLGEESFGSLVTTLTEHFPEVEIQPYYGGQSFYDVVGSVE
jgi:DAK2 domain fusion protein YloV